MVHKGRPFAAKGTPFLPKGTTFLPKGTTFYHRLSDDQRTVDGVLQRLGMGG
jgi:hypothetical protein